MPSYSGVWSLPAQLQAYASQNWPQGPGAPTSVSATAGDSQATITFVAPTFTGVPPGITGYRAISDPGGFTATGASSPLTVTGLTNGTSYTFTVDATNGVQYGPAGTSDSVTPQVTPYALTGGGLSSVPLNVISRYTISSLGNASDFGDLSSSIYSLAACSSSTTAIFSGGYSPINNVIQYVTFSSTGNTSDFGDLLTPLYRHTGLSSETRGIFAGGLNDVGAEVNSIQYITISSAGNATDFGDMSSVRESPSGCSSTTRGIIGGGRPGPTSSIVYITIASTGNSTNFGNLSAAKYNMACGSNSTRGLFAGSSSETNVIEYITIASTGNGTDFGDLIVGRNAPQAAFSSTRGTFSGGDRTGGVDNVIQYVTIASTGNATDFGDLTTPTYLGSACSAAHGGLA